MHNLAASFPRYTKFDPSVPVYCLTPNTGGVIHRFFDSSPISPSGRYLAVTKFPCENRTPQPGETAHIIVIDLTTGTEQVIAETYGWDTQLGAQVQWGATDDALFFNNTDKNQWIPYGVQVDINSGEIRKLDGPVYHVSPDGKHVASPCLSRISSTQLGYGVLIPPEKIPQNYGAPEKDGLFVTDIESNQCKLLVSLRQIVDACPELRENHYQKGNFYAFHTKWNPQGDRLMLVVRWVPTKNFWQRIKSKLIKKSVLENAMLKHVVTLASDGSDVQMAVNATEWARGGHHPNWCPDGRHVMMNLNAYGDGLRFVKFRYDGGPMEVLHSALGSGHPSLHPNERYLLTDAYPKEPVSFGDGTAPIRLIDLNTGIEHTLARIQVEPKYAGSRREMRVDAHPVWDNSGKMVIFNGFANGTRQVFAADTSSITSP